MNPIQAPKFFHTQLVGWTVKMETPMQTIYRRGFHGRDHWFYHLTPQEKRTPRPVLRARLSILGTGEEMLLDKEDVRPDLRYIGARIQVLDCRIDNLRAYLARTQ